MNVLSESRGKLPKLEKMSQNRLNPEKNELVRKILKNEVDVTYEEVTKSYLANFCTEKKIDSGFKILAAKFSNGELTGLAKCTKCEASFEVRVGSFLNFSNNLDNFPEL